MSRYIEADKLIGTFKEEASANYANQLFGVSSGLKIAITLVNDQPDAIIRCKDCKYAWHSAQGELRCEKWGVFDEDCVCSSDEFCSRGELKDE